MCLHPGTERKDGDYAVTIKEMDFMMAFYPIINKDNIMSLITGYENKVTLSL